jgi:hypothetical protein
MLCKSSNIPEEQAASMLRVSEYIIYQTSRRHITVDSNVILHINFALIYQGA